MAQARMDFLINTKIDKTAFIDLRKEIQSLQALTEKDLIKMGAAPDFTSAKTQLISIQDSAKKVEVALNKAFSPKLGTVSLTKFNNELKGMNLQQIANDFNRVGVAGQTAFRNLAANVLTTKVQLKESSKVLEEFGQTMTNTIKWGISSSALNSFTGAVQKAYSYAKNLDTSLNNIRIVSKQSADDMDRFAKNANRAAKELGKTTLDYTNAALIYYQQGTLSDAQVAERAETTLKMANVTGDSAKDVSNYMTAIWNNFYDGSKSIEYYADVMTALGAATASSTDEIAAGLEKFAAIADTVGLSYEYATSALATITAETRQSADVVGTALKTLFARIQDLELGETLDDGVTLGTYAQALEKIGVNALDANGGLRDMNSILDDMGSKWNTLTEAQKVATAEAVAGTRQYSQLIALMDNWDDFQKNVRTASNATGELNQQQKIYLESTQAHLNKLTATTERLYQSIIDSDGLNDLIDLFSTLVLGVTEYTEAIGGSGAVLSQLGALATKIFGNSISQEIATAISNMQLFKEKTKEATAQTKLLQQFKGIQINDGAYDRLIKMVEKLDEYQDILSETQYQEAQAMIMSRNEAANDAAVWEQRKQQAEGYFKMFTDKEIDLSQSALNINVAEAMEDLYDRAAEHQRKFGGLVKSLQNDLKTLDAEVANKYVENAENVLKEKLIQDEELLKKLQNTIKNYKKVSQQALDDGFDPAVLTSEQVNSLNEFAKVYGKVADEMIKDINKVEKTMNDAAKGMGDAVRTNVEIIDDSWDRMMNRFNTQMFAQSISDITGQLMMMSSAFSALDNFTNIWRNEDLTFGEKLLQSLLAIGTVANGIVNAFNLIHSLANLSAAAMGASSLATGGQAGAMKRLTKNTEDNRNKTAANIAAHSQLQKALQNTAANEEHAEGKIRANTDSINDNTQALVVNKNIRKQSEQLTLNDIIGIKEKAEIATPQNLPPYATVEEARQDSTWVNSYNAKLRGLKKARKNEIEWNKKNPGLVPYVPASDEDLDFQAMQHADNTLVTRKPEMARILQQKHTEDFKKSAAPPITDIGKAAAESKEDVEQLTDALGPKGAKKVTEGTSQMDKDIKQIGAGLKAIPWWIWVIVAAIAAVVIAVKAIDYFSTESKLKRALEESDKAAQKAKEAYEELSSTIEDYQNAKDSIKDLTVGTIEFYEAVVAANEKAMELIETLNLLPSQYTIGEGGLIQIDPDALEAAEFQKLQEMYRTQGLQYYNQARLQEYYKEESAKKFNKQFNTMAKMQEVPALGTHAPMLSKQKTDEILQNKDKLNHNLGALGGSQVEDKKKNYDTELWKRYNKGKTPVDPVVESTYDPTTGLYSDVVQPGEVNLKNAMAESAASWSLAGAKQAEYEKNAAKANIYAYLDRNSINTYEKQTKGAQDTIDRYIAKRTKETPHTVYNGEDWSHMDTSNENWKWYNPFDWGAAGMNWLMGDKVGKEKEKYLMETKGYTKDGNVWKDANGNVIDNKTIKEEKKNLDINKVIQENNSGAYNTDNIYNEEIAPIISTGQYIATQRGLNGTSQGYVTEALLKMKAGEELTPEFLNLLTDEERKAITHSIRGERWSTDANGNTTYETRFDDGSGSGPYVSGKMTDIMTTFAPTGMSGRSIARENEDLERYNATLEEQAGQLETTAEALEFYGIAMHKSAGTVDDHTKESAENIAQQYKFNKEYNKAVKVYNDNIDAIKAYDKALKSEKGISHDLADAMGQLSKALKEMGLSLSAETISSRLDLITKLMEGTEEEARKAYEELYKLSLLDVFKNTFGKEDPTKGWAHSYQQLVNEIDNTPIGQNIGASYSETLVKMIKDTELTIDQINQLADELGIEIPVQYNVPKDFNVNTVTFTTKAQSTTHRYTGEMPDPSDPTKNVQVDYAWVETVEPKTDAWVLPDDAQLKVKETSKSVGKDGFKKTLGNTTKSKVQKEKKVEDPKDRYHDINIELKQLENELKKVQKEQEKLVGSDLIANLQKQYSLLNEQIDATARKIGIAKEEQDELQAKLAGQGVQFNADGTIANYATAWDTQLAALNKVIETYNNLSGTAKENYKETLDKAKEDWEKFKENISRYDTLITDEIPGLEEDIREALDQQIEIKLEAFEYSIKLRLDLSEAERDWNAFKTKIIDGIKEDDILGNARARLANFNTYYNDEGTGEIQATTKHVNTIMEQLRQMDADQAAGIYGETYKYTNAQGEEVEITYNDRQKALDDLKEYYTILMGSLEEVYELEQQMHQSYLDMMDEAQEKFDEQVETYQTINEIIQHNMTLAQLMYGDDTSLAKYYQQQEKNLASQMDFQKQQIAFWRNQMDTLEEGSDAWEKAKENWIAAGNEWRALAEQNLQLITDKYLDAVNTIFDNLNNKVTSGAGLDYLSTEWELMNKNADRYLDSVNSIYSIQTLQNKYNEAIDGTDSITQQKKLKDLMEDELALLKEKDKLSQYDIDRANLKYEIALKQMALEEAQQNKTQLRLRRDSQGNYTYQYTADEEEAAKLKQELSDLYNQLYNTDTEKYRSNLDELYSIWEEYQNAMYEAAQINDPVERAKKEELLQREYGELINSIVADNEAIKANLQQSTMSHLFDLYDQNAENYELMTDEQKEIFNKFFDEQTEYGGMAFDNLFNLYNTNLDNYRNMSQGQIDTLMKEFIPQWKSGLQKMADTINGEGGFGEITRSTIEELNTLASEWDLERETAYNEAIAVSQQMQTETQKLVKDNTTLIDTYNRQLQEIKDLIADLEALKIKYQEAGKAALEAAEASYEYWRAVNNESANADNSIDTKDPDPKPPTNNNNNNNNNTKPSLNTGSTISVKPNTTWYEDSWGGGRSGPARGGKIAYINLGGSHPYNIDGLGWIKKSDIVGYDTGGYTGNWNSRNGRLAMLHQKELVLNAQDTKNMLNAIQIVRTITDSLGADLLSKLSMITASANRFLTEGEALEQIVHIDAQFPNVVNSTEIEDALNNLVNRAAQHITKN